MIRSTGFGAPSSEKHRGLRLFLLDGVLWNISDSFVLAYQTLYVLALGGSTAQVGQMTAITNLAGAAALMPGAWVSEMFGRRKTLIIAFGGIVSRLPLLLLAMLPLAFTGQAAIYAAMVLLAIRLFGDNFAKPAWTSFTADLIPLRLRGSYFSTRNFAMAGAAFVTVPLFGILIRNLGGLTGYQVSWLLVFIAAAASTVAFAFIKDTPSTAPRASTSLKEIAGEMLAERPFVAFTAVTLIWNLALQLAGPFFNVYLVQDMGASAALVGIVTAVNSVSGLVGQRWFGRYYSRLGDMGIFRITGLVIPALPVMWAVISAPWQVGIINGIGGFMWAGYNLAQFNLLLALTPAKGRERFTAVYQTAVFLPAFFAPLIGAWLADMLGFRLVFIMSGAGRLLATLLFIYLISARSRAKKETQNAADSSD
ncbi:MAG: MFS transporter [Anaerolineae bacterium]